MTAGGGPEVELTGTGAVKYNADAGRSVMLANAGTTDVRVKATIGTASGAMGGVIVRGVDVANHIGVTMRVGSTNRVLMLVKRVNNVDGYWQLNIGTQVS